MRYSIHLVHNRGFRWFHRSGMYFKGYIRTEGQHLEGEKALDYFTGFSGVQSAQDSLPRVDGMFTVLIRINDQLLVIVDRMRTFPLFYSHKKDAIMITDDPYQFHKIHPLDAEYAKEFLLTGFTTGRNTLLKDVYQTRPCEAILFGDGKTISRPYESHIASHIFSESFDDLFAHLQNLLQEISRDFIKSLNGRPAVLSLSGGYDSRLIAWMLWQCGYHDVLCFTYGRAGNEELENSRRTAEQLGFDWLFVEYREGMVDDYLESPTFQEYVRFSSKLSSMPFLIDYFAVQHLQRHQLVPDNAVFITGHSGDSVAGSHLKGQFNAGDSAERAARLLYKSAYNLSRISGRKDFYTRLLREMESGSGPAYARFENWILLERQAKFIVNSACVYDFFGYEYRMPLWDIRLLKFFRQVPLEHKNFKYLYDQVLRSTFSKAHLDFKDELQPTVREIQLQKIKERVKDLLPAKLVRRLQKQQPWHAYDLLTMPMQKAIRGTIYENQCGPEYNSVICNWYIAEYLKTFE